MSDLVLSCDHAVSLSSGRVVAPGGHLSPDELGAEDAWLRDDDLLLDAAVGPDELTGDALKQRAKDLNIEGRGDMLAGDLRKAIAAREADIREGK